MALIREIVEKRMEQNSTHKEISATYTVFERDGTRFLQLDSYGSVDRQIPGKKSQSFQFDEKGAERLFAILKREFGFK